MRAIQGARPLADRDRVAPARKPAAVPARAPRPCAFSITHSGDQISGRAAGVSAETVRALSSTREPVATLDLHGRRAAEVAAAVTRFVAGAGSERTVRIVVGRGLHSAGGPVLGAAVTEALTRAPLARRVLAFCSAPPRLGGDGAVLVLLRKS